MEEREWRTQQSGRSEKNTRMWRTKLFFSRSGLHYLSIYLPTHFLLATRHSALDCWCNLRDPTAMSKRRDRVEASSPQCAVLLVPA